MHKITEGMTMWKSDAYSVKTYLVKQKKSSILQLVCSLSDCCNELLDIHEDLRTKKTLLKKMHELNHEATQQPDIPVCKLTKGVISQNTWKSDVCIVLIKDMTIYHMNKTTPTKIKYDHFSESMAYYEKLHDTF